MDLRLWPSGNCYEGEWKHHVSASYSYSVKMLWFLGFQSFETARLGKMSGQGTMIWRNGTSHLEESSSRFDDRFDR